MEERGSGSCWLWLLPGLLGLALLGWFLAYVSGQKATNLQDTTRSTAQEALDTRNFVFASAGVSGAALVISGQAPDAAARDAACKAAEDAVRQRGMVGVPGIVARVDCQITAPGGAPSADAGAGSGSAAAQTPAVADVPRPTSPAPATVLSEADKAAAGDCQARLTAAARSGKVEFALNGNDIIAGTRLLDQVAEIAKQCQRFAIEVGGHTDKRGGDGINVPLSQRRAEVVRQYLIAKGVPASQLTARGYGSSVPIDAAATGNDEPRNRRTEFTITALD